MITFEEAKAIALNTNSFVNTCDEYQIAYHFFDKDTDVDGDNGIIVFKENGRVSCSFVEFILNYQPEIRAKRIPFGKK